mmetsp:Transcript_20055/g.29752  ORF Transcript_20055/g.29752 Transcript_20055/m.29752 type:complete len:465 (-) Transcript_20055:32-1426(-)|eukprot:CAMPEP_0194214680 /NCGR_PEP_ID=MMETSP0156-20130528/16017_1 /TAXON_ID=33649 /ORGANISM="Thalassionema nitzschioides, Strain L26-B" /LENGTH=464 /DNA_ID=CAMNT_0038943001 /DNA_START=22 /DNA_END=1416 /DNA_ORIENTATION=+
MFKRRVHAAPPPVNEISVSAQISNDKPEEKYWALKNLSKEIERKLRTNGITKNLVENLDSSTLNALLKELDISMETRCKLLLDDDEIEEQDIVREKEDEGFVGKEICCWAKALGICIITTIIPTLTIGLLHFFGHDAPPDWMTSDPEKYEQEILEYQLSRVILPSLVILLLVFFLTPRFSLFFVAKLTSNRSKGVEIKEVMECTLANNGIISALLLTVVFAALQAALPVEDTPSSYLNMFYSMFLLMALFYSFTATIMSSICYLYMQPLNGAALKNFIGEMSLYYGMPITGMMLTLWLLLNAATLWLWGQYGATIGISAIVISFFFCVRVLVCIQSLNGWENPYLFKEIPKSRELSAFDQTDGNESKTSKGLKRVPSFKSLKTAPSLKPVKSFTKNRSFRRQNQDEIYYEDNIEKLEDEIKLHERKLEKKLKKKRKESRLKEQESVDEHDPNVVCGIEIFDPNN